MARSTDITTLSIALLLTLAIGCCRLPTARNARAPLPVPASVQSEYAPAIETDLTHVELGVTNQGHYTLRQVQLASPPSRYATNRSIRLDCFIPHANSPGPVLLLLPILGGKDYPLERHFAKYFAKKGLASIIVHREQKGKPSEAAQIEGWLRQTILDNRQALDWIETQEAFDPDRIGLFGISMGGIKGAMLAPLDRRIKAGNAGARRGRPALYPQSNQRGGHCAAAQGIPEGEPDAAGSIPREARDRPDLRPGYVRPLRRPRKDIPGAGVLRHRGPHQQGPGTS